LEDANDLSQGCRAITPSFFGDDLRQCE